MTEPSCLLADDHPALTAAVSAYLSENGFTIVGPAPDGRRAVQLATEAQPELALIDYRMPRLAGTDLIEALREVAPETKIVVYTAEGDDELARNVLAAGAVALVLKEAPLADLVRALEAALDGRLVPRPRARQGPRPGPQAHAARARRARPARRRASARGDRPQARHQLRDRPHPPPQSVRPARRGHAHAGRRNRAAAGAHRVSERSLAEIVERQLEVASLSGEVDAVMQGIVDRLLELPGADGASLSTVDGELAYFRVAAGADAALLHQTLPIDETLGVECLRRGGVTVLRATEGPEVQRCLTPGAGAIVLAPIDYDGATRGILGLRSPDPNAFDTASVETISLLATSCGRCDAKRRGRRAACPQRTSTTASCTPNRRTRRSSAMRMGACSRRTRPRKRCSGTRSTSCASSTCSTSSPTRHSRTNGPGSATLHSRRELRADQVFRRKDGSELQLEYSSPRARRRTRAHDVSRRLAASAQRRASALEPRATARDRRRRSRRSPRSSSTPTLSRRRSSSGRSG